MPIIDEFYYKQPPLAFVDDLKRPYYEKKAETFSRTVREEGEVDISGVYLSQKFPDPEGLLETVYSEFERFSKLFEIFGERYPIIIKQSPVRGFESFRIEAKEDNCVITAEDTEGVRRALISVMDELVKREGAFLPTEKIEKRAVIKTRITRGFFSPTNRPPKNRDELMDDVDYYPDEYLNRLAHDGINGIWIYTRFSDLMESPYMPEYGKDGERRREKLRRVAKKCKKYGIKVYIFAIEPFNLTPELAKKHPDMLGADPLINEYFPVCPSSEGGAKYIVDMAERIFRALPEIAGFIDITYGERMTSCVTSPTYHTCPRCSKKPKGEVLADVVNLIREGIRRAGTGAEMISWTYGHRLWEHSDIREYVRKCDSDVSIMQNFEDMGYPEQLGKTRIAVDYWLSYVGPSPMFEITADEAVKTKKELYAKMQICCSHELATVPYIPAPGIIYDKFKEALAVGVTGVVECWYFGNYPSLMSKAAGELSFVTDKEQTKEEFIFDLSAKLYGKSRADEVKKAFLLFENAYKNYPVNVMFSYYGPIHDGIVWRLRLKPADKCLSRSWQLLDVPDGDKISECLWYGHTLNEAIALTDVMQRDWGEGVPHLAAVSETELYPLALAISLLFKSGNNVLRFYSLRDALGKGYADPRVTLSEMEKIVFEEIESSRKMISLCERDSRLGYHSEAEGFKFFPEKLASRIEYLENLLKTEFSEVRERIERGLSPLEYYEGKVNGEPRADAYIIRKCDIADATAEKIDSTESTVRLSYDDENIYIELSGKRNTEYILSPEFTLGFSAPAISLCNGRVKLTSEVTSHQSVFGDKVEWALGIYKAEAEITEENAKNLITIPREKTEWREGAPLRLWLGVREPGSRDFLLWQKADDLIQHLGKSYSDPKGYAWILNEN